MSKSGKSPTLKAMKAARLALAAASVLALLALGSVVAFAAPGALGRAASPDAGAAHAVYCSDSTVRQLKATITAYRARIPRDRARYFKAHSAAKARARFVKLQSSQLTTLQKKLKNCT
jgi:hypothetical protein